MNEITGGDTIACRFPYGEHFEDTPQFKIALVTNHRPKVDGTDDALWRRLPLVPVRLRPAPLALTEGSRDLLTYPGPSPPKR